MNEKLIEVMARAEYEHAWGKGAHWPPHNPQTHAKFIRRAHAVLAALQSAGYAVVPVEPTDEMLFAAHQVTNERSDPANNLACYRAMIEATKNPPQRELERAKALDELAEIDGQLII